MATPLLNHPLGYFGIEQRTAAGKAIGPLRDVLDADLLESEAQALGELTRRRETPRVDFQ
jgi:hypothetical protein